MYIVQYLNGTAVDLWYFPDVTGKLLDEHHTEKRKEEWDKLIVECRLKAMKKHPAEYANSEFLVVMRSRLSPKDIPDIEYRKFTELVAELSVGRLIGKHNPKMVDNKLK